MLKVPYLHTRINTGTDKQRFVMVKVERIYATIGMSIKPSLESESYALCVSERSSIQRNSTRRIANKEQHTVHLFIGAYAHSASTYLSTCIWECLYVPCWRWCVCVCCFPFARAIYHSNTRMGTLEILKFWKCLFCTHSLKSKMDASTSNNKSVNKDEDDMCIQSQDYTPPVDTGKWPLLLKVCAFVRRMVFMFWFFVLFFSRV